MILQRIRRQTIAVKQEDHAHFAEFLLQHWSDHRFSRDPNRDEILFATREHDNGWHEYDAAPRLHSRTKLPIDFKNINADEAYSVWIEGSRMYITNHPYASLLITHHGYTLHEHAHDRKGVWQPFFTELAHQRANLRDKLGMTQNQVEHGYSFLRMMDWFSLAWCSNPKLGKEKPEQYAGYKYKREGNQFLFRPYPFDERELQYQLPTYPLLNEGYDSPEALAADLASPTYQQIILNPL